MPRRQPGPSLEQPGPAVARLEPYQEQIARWLHDEHLKLTRIQELLDQRGMPVKYTTLRRFVRQSGLAKAPKSTVRMAETAPGVAGLALREIPGGDRTTPAGRFVCGYGPSIDAGRVLWVDHESDVSIHPTATGVPAERRVERLASPTPDDNRITHGCINVSPEFYEQVMRTTFERGGVFYILPDKKSLADTFPEFAQSHAAAERGDRKGARASRE